MGNFKHQSIRSTDRGDREKEGDKERERDIRDKEGQEKLRHVGPISSLCWLALILATASYPTSMTATA